MPSLTRRRALAGAGSALCATTAGCLFADGSDAPGSTESDPRFPEVALRADPRASDTAAYDAELLQGFTASHPATVEVSFRNKTDRARTFPFGPSPPFSGLVGTPPDRDDEHLVLVPDRSFGHADFYDTEEPHGRLDVPSEVVPAEPTDDCWRALGLIENEPVQTTRTIEAGATLSNTYTVLASAEAGCFEAPRYCFQSNSLFGDRGKWGFELVLE